MDNKKQKEVDPAMDELSYGLLQLKFQDNYIIGEFDAVIPYADKNGKRHSNVAKYIRIEHGDEWVLVKTIKAAQYRNNIIINPNAITTVNESLPVRITKVSAFNYLWYKLRKDPSLIWAKWTLGTGILALIIDGLQGLGKIDGLNYWSSSACVLGSWMIVSYLCKIIAVTVVFIKGIKGDK